MAKLDRVDRLKKLGGGSVLILIIMVGVTWFLSIFIKWVWTPDPPSKSLEAKQYIRSINRGQQAYLAEHGNFSNSINALGLGIKIETSNYKYSIRATKTASFHYAISKQANVKSYVGGVFVLPDEPKTAKEYTIIFSILCASDSPGKIRLAEPKFIKSEPVINSHVVCGQGTTQVVR